MSQNTLKQRELHPPPPLPVGSLQLKIINMKDFNKTGRMIKVFYLLKKLSLPQSLLRLLLDIV